MSFSKLCHQSELSLLPSRIVEVRSMIGEFLCSHCSGRTD
uniref:Uncharacterized protein n=1 Tax=Arundo donax TaxID=35708 RepID=A0A0A9AM83_ARUDO